METNNPMDVFQLLFSRDFAVIFKQILRLACGTRSVTGESEAISGFIPLAPGRGQDPGDKKAVCLCPEL